MRDLDKAALDRYITGNWGEDQFKEISDEDEIGFPDDIPEDGVDVCPYCWGPDDHGIDCRPASEGGTMPDVVRS